MPRARKSATDNHETVLAQLNAEPQAEPNAKARDDHSATRAARERVSRAADAVRDHVETTVDDLGDAAQATRDKAADIGSSASDAAADMYRELQHELDRAYEAGYQSASYAYKRGRNEIGHFVRENPLTVCALGFAGGVILGALLPRTRIEDRTIGEYSDAATRRARAAAEDALRTRHEAVMDTVDSASKRTRERVRAYSDEVS